MKRDTSPPLCSVVRQPKAVGKHWPKGYSWPLTRHSPHASGDARAHGTVWEAPGNERALCLGAVKGACLPVLSREGPRPNEGCLCRWGLAHVPLQRAWWAPDTPAQGSDRLSSVPAQFSQHSSSSLQQSQSIPKPLQSLSVTGGMLTPAERAAPSFSTATTSLSPIRTSASKQEHRRHKTPEPVLWDPRGASSALRQLHKPKLACPIISKRPARQRRGHCQQHGSHRRVQAAIHRFHLPAVLFLYPSKTQHTAHTVNTPHVSLSQGMDPLPSFLSAAPSVLPKHKPLALAESDHCFFYYFLFPC